MRDWNDFRILEFLLNKKKWKFKKEILNELELSYSSLQYHLGHINSSLKKSGINKINLKSKKIENYKEIHEFKNNMIRYNRQYFLDKNERRLVLSIILLFSYKISLTKLANVFKVTKNLIFLDIQNLKDYWNSNNTTKKIKIISSKTGYQIVGQSVDIHRVLINEVNDFIERDHDGSLLNFILNTIKFDDYKILKFNKITNHELFFYLEEKIQKIYFKFGHINFKHKSLTLFIFFFLVKKMYIDIESSELSQLAQIKEESKVNEWFKTASNFLDEIKVRFGIKEMIGYYEKIYIGQLISSYLDLKEVKLCEISKINAKNISLYFQKNFIQKGFGTNINIDNNVFTDYLIWIQNLPLSKMIILRNKKMVEDFFKESEHKTYFINIYKSIYDTLSKEFHFFDNETTFWESAALFYFYITKIPLFLDESEKVLIVSNLCGVDLIYWLCNFSKYTNNHTNFKVLSLNYFSLNEKNFKNFKIFTEIEGIQGDNIYYLPFKC